MVAGSFGRRPTFRPVVHLLIIGRDLACEFREPLFDAPSPDAQEGFGELRPIEPGHHFLDEAVVGAGVVIAEGETESPRPSK